MAHRGPTTERDPLLPSSELESSQQIIVEQNHTPDAQASTGSSPNNLVMSSTTLGLTSETGRQASRGRISYLDSLRVFLTILVIFHHAALAFGGVGGWYYYDPSCSSGAWNVIPSDPDSEHESDGTGTVKPRPLLVLFVVLNQSFFMASFFVMSGYFSALSLRKRVEKAALAGRGRGRAVGGFVKDKLVRLGVPTVNTNVSQSFNLRV
jgi:hypothetical protein